MSSDLNGEFHSHASCKFNFLRSFLVEHYPLGCGGGGSGFEAMGTHPMAAARANGNQAATDAIFTFIHKFVKSSKCAVTDQWGGGELSWINLQ